MSTQITTAARRIQRDLSGTSPQIATTYDPDGHSIGITTCSGRLARVHAREDYGWVLVLSGHSRTQREIQELLDSAQWASDHHDEIEMPIEDAFGYRLQEVDTARETARSLYI
jgi:hypothetical protein